MKKILLGSLLVASSSAAFAYGPAGCGLGTLVFQNPTELHEHVLMATTNGIYGNQTFGMTSGTLGCEAGSKMASNTEVFMDQNLDQIAMEAAQGQGETLDALGQMMGVSADDQVHFSAALQSNFDSIFDANANSANTFERVQNVMKSTPALQKYVG